VILLEDSGSDKKALLSIMSVLGPSNSPLSDWLFHTFVHLSLIGSCHGLLLRAGYTVR